MLTATPRTAVSGGEASTSGMSYALPNVPVQPRNGMIRTYDNQDRTFSRPYSAKTVFFYKEGDEYFTGVRVPISKSRYRTIDGLLDDLNKNIQMPYGVRRLTTPMGRTPIENISQLEHLGKYVASSSKYSRGINLSALERLRKARELTEESLRRQRAGGQSFWVGPAFHGILNMLTLRKSATMPNVKEAVEKKIVVITVFFLLNGKGRFYRTLLNPLRLPTMEQLLVEVSNGLEMAIFRVYTSEGVRILNVSDMLSLNPPKMIACPRNERPSMRDTVQLPLITPSRYMGTRKWNKTGSDSTPSQSSSADNAIEKPRAFQSAFRRNIRKTTGAPRKKVNRPLPALPMPKKASSLPDETDSGKAASISSLRTSSSKVDNERASGLRVRGKPATIEVVESPVPLLSDTEDDEEEDMMIDDDSRPVTAVSRKSVQSVGEKNDEEKDMSSSEGENDEVVDSGRRSTIPKQKSQEEGENGVIERMSTGCSQNEDDLSNEIEEAERKSTACSQTEDNLPDGDELLGRKATACSQKEDDLPNNIESARKPSTSCSQREEELPDEIESASRPETVCSQKEDNLPSDVETEEVLPSANKDQAATKIQAVFRGFNARKKFKVRFAKPADETLGNVPEEVKAPEAEDMDTSSSPAKQERVEAPEPGTTTYTISVLTGNRWGAESEADLYIRLHGDDGTSDVIQLANDADEPKFRTSKLDSFHADCHELGTLTKITLGHTKKGYGAGIFIDYVLVTENHMEGRQFIFFVNKWIDSGQVDGKLERAVFVTAFYYVNSIPEEDVISHGRWEFKLYSGTSTGLGATTSNLIITGYGTEGSSMILIENDITLQTVPSTTLIQVDFGNIGELIKVRFEVDGEGEMPNWYLDYVELKDLDTDERLAVRVGRWLDVTGENKRPQPFREIAVFRSGVQPLSIIAYEGRVLGADLQLLTDSILYGELHGEFDSGVFPMTYNEAKQEFTFKVECVYLGRVNKMKVIANFSEQGQAIMEGLSVLQDIWDCYSPGVSVADQVLAPLAYVRESSHCPYRYVLNHGKVIELDENKPYFKTLCLTGMEGLSTRFKKEEIPSGNADWTVVMSVEGSKVQQPSVWLCSGATSLPMEYVDLADSILSYKLKNSSVTTIDKIRIGVGEIENGHKLIVKKMRLENSLTHSEVRYPNVQTEFKSNHTYEYSTVYPDIPPKLNLLYHVGVRTLSCTGMFLPFVNIIGTDSNSGMRAIGKKRVMKEGSEHFELEAVHIGELREVEVKIEGDKDASWSFELTVTQQETERDFETKQGSIAGDATTTKLSLIEI